MITLPTLFMRLFKTVLLLNLSGYENKNAKYFKADTALRHVLGEFQQFLFLGKPPYVRYLCRGLVVSCRAVEFCSVFAVPEGNRFGSDWA